jgi:leucyl aminopeptidase (aminopeptidase T)
MAGTWRAAFAELGLPVQPLLSLAATGADNADLPATGRQDGREVEIVPLLARCHIVVAMTRFSATAPLSRFVKELPHLRAASMPGVLRRMEQSALAADYRQVAARCRQLADRLTHADSASVTFSTGHRIAFDLRYRTGLADDGLCTPEKSFPLINLPSGEAFVVPYEGERAGTPSQTRGVIPVRRSGETVLLHVEENRIEQVEGGGPAARAMDRFFDVDPARRNLAELGLGCNDRAVVLGNVLEDEKAGMHWAYGRSEHLGGTVGPSAFSDPRHVVHTDIVYAAGCPVTVSRLVLEYPGAEPETIIRDSAYQVFEVP